MTDVTLPSKAIINHYPGIVGLDRIVCKQDGGPLLTAEACEALNRLVVAAAVRKLPRRAQVVSTVASPALTFLPVEIRTATDRPLVEAAFRAADAGDPEPARALAEAWFSEWPADCGWRFDFHHEVSKVLADGPMTAREIWHRLKELPTYWKSHRLRQVTEYLDSLAAKGVFRREYAAGRWIYSHTGPVIEYDPLRTADRRSADGR